MEIVSDLLRVESLKKYYPIERGFFRKTIGNVKAVDNISFAIKTGETLGLVGESGCGKSTLGRCILRATEPTEGKISFQISQGTWVNLGEYRSDQLNQAWREMQLIFQNPYSSLNPRKRILDVIGEPLMAHRIVKGQQLKERVAELLDQVGLQPDCMLRYPHAFSGGQRQRIGIARALALNPKFIVCDEPVSALDVSVQAQVLNLLLDLKIQRGLTYLFISHDLSVVEHISDRVAVMYVGKIVEIGETNEVFINPAHPYTEALMSAVPKPDPLYQSDEVILKGEIANPANPPSGCYFHPRCQYTEDTCKRFYPDLFEISPGHFVSCHRYGKIKLRGIGNRN